MDLYSNLTTVKMHDSFPLSIKEIVALIHLCSNFPFFFKLIKNYLFILLPSPPVYPLNSNKSRFILPLPLRLCWHLPHCSNVLLICQNYKRQIDWFPTFQITFFSPPLRKLAIKISMMKRHFVSSDVCLYKCSDSVNFCTVCYSITVTKMMKLVSDVPSLW